LFELQRTELSNREPDSVYILPPAGKVTGGDPLLGYQYLLYGDQFNSGIPYPFYKAFFQSKTFNPVSLAGFNKYSLNEFTIFGEGQKFATPGCFHCHAQQFDGRLVVGLGNSYSKFQVDLSKYLKPARFFTKLFYGKRSEAFQRIDNFYKSGLTLAPEIILETQGPNPGHRIADVMASHRDPVTLKFRSDTTYFTIPAVPVPTDIPALWLLKRKNALHYNGMAQGDGVRHAMISTILTLSDTSEAEKIYRRMQDIWAYLETLEPPKYPYPVNEDLVKEGRLVFNTNCASCHGTYGKQGHYPNKLIPERIIGTDSLLLKYTTLYKGYEDWYNKSWYASGSQPAYTKAQYGYVAQPLDGIWITAPYFHNGSVPNLEAVLNSRIRPRYWKRNFDKHEYDYEKIGWKHKVLHKPGGKKTYDTTIPGYGNYGHYFGDKLSQTERRSLIEYLKTI